MNFPSSARNPLAGSRKLRLVMGATFLVLFPYIVWATMTIARDVLTRDLLETGSRKLDLYVTSLQRELERFEFLPQILAQNQDVINTLNGPDGGAQVGPLNRYLEKFNGIADSSDTYVMDATGLTVAASNWNAERPFVGMNFGFRPYFQNAMSGIPGRYFALGSRSNRRGFYFSYPVRKEDRILGAAVVKVGTDRLEGILSRRGDTVIVTDRDGIIFLTTQAQWKFRAFHALTEPVKLQLKESRRYGDEELALLPVVEEESFERGARRIVVRGGNPHGAPGGGNPDREQRFLAQSAQVPYAAWTVHLLTDLRGVERSVLGVTILVATTLALVFLAAAYLALRRVALLERLQYQRRSEETLTRARDELEQRVRERTADLLGVNLRLEREITERRRTEETLRTAQDELVQAGKLAVIGQMSAGITHELNQPLAAIRSYSENARVLLDRGRHEEARTNLGHVVELTDRMAEITRHLKSFARKTTGEAVAVSLAAAVDNALALLASHTKLDLYEIVRDFSSGDLLVMGEPVRLEQVVLNLLTNALDAMRPAGCGRITVTIRQSENKVVLTVRDTGPGIAEQHLPRIFDPFFSTKEVGDGLGLGLSISNNIVRKLGGTMRVANHPEGGTEFAVTLVGAAEGRKEHGG